MKLWNTETLREIASFNLSTFAGRVRFSPDDRFVILVGHAHFQSHGCKIFQAPSWAEIKTADAEKDGRL